MPAAVLVSDIHIASPEGDRCRRFIEFLAALEHDDDVRELYLLGDIFDLWVADHDYFISRYTAVIERLRTLRARGVEIAYFEGNHDLYLTHFWEKSLGCTIYGGPAHLTIGDQTVRLEHGDQMNPDDKGYLFLRWFLRTPPVHFLCRHLPGWLIARIGEKASATSRQHSKKESNGQAAGIVDIIRTHAKRAFRERQFDMLISGHVHTRDDCVLEVDGKAFRSVNLGTWLDAPCAFRIDGSGARFVELSDTSAAATAAAGPRPERTAGAVS